MSGQLRPKSLGPTRPMPASAPATTRNLARQRALFGLDLHRPQLVAAWWKGDALSARAAASLWAAHPWGLVALPPDGAALIE